MSDDELVNRYSDVSRKLSFYSTSGASPEVVEQLRNILSAISLERMERTQKELFDERMKQQKSVVETEPDLSPEPKRPKPGERLARKPLQRMCVIRSDRPMTASPDVPPAPSTNTPPKEK